MSARRSVVGATFSFTILVSLSAGSLLAQGNTTGAGWNPLEILKTEGYVKPPADVEKLIMTPRMASSL